MPVSISDEALESAHLTEAELKTELALALFQTERLTLGQAARLAEVGQLDFQRSLTKRRVLIHYGIEELVSDLNTIRQVSR